MKKIVFLSLFALCLPLGMMAQSNDDDLYFIPSKDKEKAAPVKKAPAKREVTTNIYAAPGTTVVVQDRKGNVRDVDEYNRRYDSRNNEFAMENDTVYIKEKSRPDLEGEWVNGEFEGSQDDYEYAERLIRFRNPRYAISVSSPLYWDVMYGMNSWDWNVYSDGLYAYAFPTFGNPLWSSWRFNSFGSGWGFGFGSSYYGWGGGYYPGYYGGYYGGWYGGGYGGGYWGGGWGHHHHYGNYYANNNRYTNRRSEGRSSYGSASSTRRTGSDAYRSDRSSTRSSGTSSYNRNGQSSTRRVVGTRPMGERSGVSTRTDASSTRRNTYTRPSSTRGNSSYDAVRGSISTPSSAQSTPRSSGTRTSTYNRGSSSETSRRSSTESTRSYTPSSSTRSYSSPSSSSSRSSSSYSSGSGGSTRSSGSSSGSSSRSRR